MDEFSDWLRSSAMTEIVTAVQRGSQVYVHGPNQRQLCSVFAGNCAKRD